MEIPFLISKWHATGKVWHNFDNYSSELDAMYGDDVDLDIRPTSRNIRGRNPANDQDGAEGPHKRKK